MEADMPHNVGFIKPATIFFQKEKKMGVQSPCLLLNIISVGTMSC